MTAEANTLFEISWEVCNKVGGIHTVIMSKLKSLMPLYKDYVLIGPLFERNPQFEERRPSEEWERVLARLKDRGVTAQFGVWLTPEEPTVVLVSGRHLDVRDLRTSYWERFRIDSIRASFEFDEPMQFATAAGMVVEEYAQHRKRIVMQCHEWMAGFALLHCKGIKQIASVFTTHATILGRTIMGNGYPLYSIIDEINPEEWARKLNVEDKHTAEVACAHNADVFTTVSEITGMEASRLLGRKPDVLLFNGFTTKKFSTFEETSVKHDQSRDALRELAAYTFFPHYAFDLESTMFFFTSGRYEFQNKGIDVIIEALGRLNERLRDAELTIIMFFWVIMGRRQVKVDMLEKKNAYYHIKSYVEWQGKPLLQKVILDFMSGHSPGEQDAFTSDFFKNLHRDVQHIHRDGLPPMLTHEIDNPENDPILTRCLANGLNNDQENRVKVLLYPGYLDGSDGLLHTDYYDTTVGTHLGIFPSHYEPWGYTPLESAVLGVPAVTTDLAGFGQYIKDRATNGVFVIPRMGRDKEEVVQDLTELLFRFTQMSHEQRVQAGFTAKTLAGHCDWAEFIHNYIKAHNLALKGND